MSSRSNGSFQGYVYFAIYGPTNQSVFYFHKPVTKISTYTFIKQVIFSNEAWGSVNTNLIIEVDSLEKNLQIKDSGIFHELIQRVK